MREYYYYYQKKGREEQIEFEHDQHSSQLQTTIIQSYRTFRNGFKNGDYNEKPLLIYKYTENNSRSKTLLPIPPEITLTYTYYNAQNSHIEIVYSVNQRMGYAYINIKRSFACIVVVKPPTPQFRIYTI